VGHEYTIASRELFCILYSQGLFDCDKSLKIVFETEKNNIERFLYFEIKK
jgi:hypothetical protein